MKDLLYKDVSFLIRGLIFEIRNNYGPGQKESIYKNLFEESLKQENIGYEKEKSIPIFSLNNKKVGVYRPDFVIEDKLIIEIKSSRFTTRIDEKQLYYYLRNSKYEVGFLVNFFTPKLYIKRIIYTNDRKPFLSVENKTQMDTNKNTDGHG